MNPHADEPVDTALAMNEERPMNALHTRAGLAPSLAAAFAAVALQAAQAQPTPPPAPAPSTAPAAAPAGRSTLDAVKQRGQLVCGVIGTFFGFSAPDSKGEMRGLDADSCRAVAAAVFGDPNKVKFVNLTAQQRFPALQSGEVDVLYANATWTMSRDARMGLQFATINYYDGAGFVVRKSANIKSAKELNGASICIQSGGTGEQVTNDFFRRSKLSYKPVLIADAEENRRAFLAGRCDAYQSDTTVLSAFIRNQGPRAGEFMVLPETISNEPLGGAVRKGDDRWFDIVRWTHYALLLAEQHDVTQENVEKMLSSPVPDVRRLLGVEGDLGTGLGLDNKWAYNAIKAVGNYGEIWSRSIGPTGLPRGLNRHWTDGGLHYTPPMR
jgi:general L-amino acid transport system substrate-binding protein